MAKFIHSVCFYVGLYFYGIIYTYFICIYIYAVYIKKLNFSLQKLHTRDIDMYLYISKTHY